MRSCICFTSRDCCEELMACRHLRQQSSVPASILFSAVCRNLEIIGEAAKKIGPAYRAANPAIPWREMSDLRNVLIHQYEGTDEALVWGRASCRGRGEISV